MLLCFLQDPSVMSAALCALQEVVARDPKPYKNLIPSFISILKQARSLCCTCNCSAIITRQHCNAIFIASDHHGMCCCRLLSTGFQRLMITTELLHRSSRYTI